MTERVYHIELDDYATPGFVTFGKDYYGTMADVEEFISKPLQVNVFGKTLKRYI